MGIDPLQLEVASKGPKPSFEAWEGRDMAMVTHDGYAIERRMPGFNVWRNSVQLSSVGLFTEAVATIIVEREAAQVLD